VINFKRIIILLILIIIYININSVQAKIQNKTIASVANKIITSHDLQSEMKLIFILTKQSSKIDQKNLQKIAFQSLVGKLIRTQAIEEKDNIIFNEKDLENELNKVAINLKLSTKDLKNIFYQNNLDYSLLIDKITIDLKWNSLIFDIYKNKVTVNQNEINKQLKEIKSKQYANEYLISEILTDVVDINNVNDKIKEIKIKIKNGGFENTAIEISTASSAQQGGNLGWLKESEISTKYKNLIEKTKIGDITDPIILP